MPSAQTYTGSRASSRRRFHVSYSACQLAFSRAIDAAASGAAPPRRRAPEPRPQPPPPRPPHRDRPAHQTEPARLPEAVPVARPHVHPLPPLIPLPAQDLLHLLLEQLLQQAP